MAFEMDGEFVLPASRVEVWRALNDPEVLCRCIQGCQKLTRTGDNSFAAEVKMKIGPVSSLFNGKVDLTDLDPPSSYRIMGQGDGGAAGFAKGGATVTLADTEGGTLLRYTVHADIGGRLAQLGGRLINGVARKQADLFFEAFAAQFGAGAATPESAGGEAMAAGTAPVPAAVGAPVTHAPAPSMGAPWAWLVALALGVLAGFLLGRSEADDWWVVAMIALALASAGAGYRAGRG